METVVGVMEDEGIEVAFGVPGAAILSLYKALSRSDRIAFRVAKCEKLPAC
jgi:tartronate-semialdehyde synthase